jgi:hypothetical protein
MPQNAQAQILASPQTSEQDYEALIALLSATARGRAFLAEHARRSRIAETATLRDALKQVDDRLGELLGPQSPEATPDAPPAALAHLVELLEPVAPNASPSPATPLRAPLAALMALSEEERLAVFT